MEEILEALYLGNANGGDIEDAILFNILVDRDNVVEQPQFNLDNVSEEFAKINFRFNKNDIPSLVNALE